MSCIHAYLASVGSECPECKTPVNPENLRPWSRVLRAMLSELKLRCNHVDKGCNAIVTLGSIAAHEKECKFGLQTCKWCRESIEASSISRHEDR